MKKSNDYTKQLRHTPSVRSLTSSIISLSSASCAAQYFSISVRPLQRDYASSSTKTPTDDYLLSIAMMRIDGLRRIDIADVIGATEREVMELLRVYRRRAIDIHTGRLNTDHTYTPNSFL